MEGKKMEPELWGMFFWIYLFILASKVKKVSEKFIHSISKILPCETCAEEYEQFCKRHQCNLYPSLLSWFDDVEESVRLRNFRQIKGKSMNTLLALLSKRKSIDEKLKIRKTHQMEGLIICWHIILLKYSSPETDTLAKNHIKAFLSDGFGFRDEIPSPCNVIHAIFGNTSGNDEMWKDGNQLLQYFYKSLKKLRWMDDDVDIDIRISWTNQRFSPDS